MAVEKVDRVLVAVHDGCRDRFLAALQRAGVMHIVRTESASGDASDVGTGLSRLIAAVESLAPREKKEGGLFGSARTALTQEEFDRVAAELNPGPLLDELAGLNRELAELDARERAVEAELARVESWIGLRSDLADSGSMRAVKVTFCRFHDRGAFDLMAAGLSGMDAAVELVSQSEHGVWAVLAAAPDEVEKVAGLGTELRYDTIDLAGVRGRPAEAAERLRAEQARISGRRSELCVRANGLVAELPRLRIAADAAAARAGREQTAAGLARTDSVSLVHGWVRRRDRHELERLASTAGPAAVVDVEPGPGEEVPVCLTNPRLFRPFEMVLELFSLPSPTEIDPTVLLAPFFAVSFGLCLTDAGYGIVAAIVTWLFMRRMGASNKLLGIILWGSIVTIPAGALVGGWFGDMPDRLGIQWLLDAKNALMWFDPVKDPMKFFLLSLGFGYVHMVYGMVIEIVDCVRVRDFAGAFLGQMPWFVSLNALLALVLLGRSLPDWARAGLMVGILASVAAVIVFTQREAASMPNQWFWFGLLTAALLFIGARLRWLPASFYAARWAVLGFTGVLLVQTVLGLVRTRRLGPVRIGLGALGLLGLGLHLGGVVPGWAGVSVCLPIIFSSPTSQASLPKLAWGAYALYGATGFVGVVLSYIRLMALGMVTGGIAVTVNVIAWMVLGIPVVGIVLALIVLLIGHTYNIAVNILGAFVHSLRLNYVEFFPRFYAGGSGPFLPFREKYEYVTLRHSRAAAAGSESGVRN